MIIMTLDEAEYVLGPSPTVEHSALEPAPLPSGEYVLPEEVIPDPANADVKQFLEGLPVREVLPEENWDFGTPEDPDEEAQADYVAAKLTWSETMTARGTPERAAAQAAGDAI
jgi:hypothetical protein